MNWPDHPIFPNYGYTITRFNLDGLVAQRAREKRGHAVERRRGRGPAGTRATPREDRLKGAAGRRGE